MIVIAVAVGSCAGGAGSGCYTQTDCASALYCVGPNDPHGCGIPPRQQCATDSDCPAGLLCHAIADFCSPSGVGSECRVKCGACDSGFRCNATGACEAIPCDESYRCPAYQRCDSAAAHRMGPVYDRTQGCVNILCTADAMCTTGQSCVSGSCQDSPGTCQKVMPVP